MGDTGTGTKPVAQWDLEHGSGISPPACSMEGSKVPATLSWTNLFVRVTDTKGKERTILNGITGYVEPRHMLAIMGPSGCGKSTLLDTLAGRLAHTAKWEGEIRVNGHKSRLSYGKAAYVTQDEVLIGTLTVFETLMYAARLRLPTSLSSDAKVKIVNDVISELGLESIRETYIGNWHIRGISGGQRRRVSIGCELVTSPTLLFLDEPTSGLDSAAALHVMSSVRRLTEGGGGCRTICTVIHQPSSEVFELFDKLCLLAQGDIVYFGDAMKASHMFEAAGLPVPPSRSAADHFLHCINKDFEGVGYNVTDNITTLVNTYSSSQTAAAIKEKVQYMHTNPGRKYEKLGSRWGSARFKETFKGTFKKQPKTTEAAGVEAAKDETAQSTDDEANQPPGWGYKTIVLTQRTFLNNVRNVGLFWMRLGMYIMLCLCIAFVYFQLNDSWKDVFSRAALLFFVVAFLTFMAIAGFPAFIEDMKVYIRERLNGYYTPSSFTVANTLAALPFIFLISVCSTVAVYWIAGLNSEGGAVIYFILCLFASLTVVESLMMAIAPIVPHFLMGIAAGAGLLGIFMIVCGFFQPLGSMPKPIFRYPLSYMSFHTYAFTGFMRNEFEGTNNWGCPCFSEPCPSVQECSRSGEDVLSYYEIMNIDKWVNLAILLGMVVFYRTAFYATLKYKESSSK